MKIRVFYGESIKDGKGDIFIYKAEIEKEIAEASLTKEQQVAQMRAIHAFLHNELHRAIEDQQMKDGAIQAPKHQDVPLK